ncbi:hypothetical protein [Paracoccus sp. (in: a-proteobacteria)]|uniref:hypothetical protein n=1 Tax=Paracoccus sp. TaxID=267 RepID=UPI0026DF8E97|nr:hypothetical protein [Paracoccus sp. (in: a-proteobacteria)]MDO5648349.1 hypothetical protein [Paracoccus sp. (in: a-proteobacteria)]
MIAAALVAIVVGDGPNGPVHAVNVMTPADNRVVVIEDYSIRAAFSVLPNMTGFPDVERTDTGFTVYAGCDVCGSMGVVNEYKFASRGGDYVLAGFTQTMNDRLSASVTVCDVNLLTGRVEIGDHPSEGASTTRSVMVAERAIAASALPPNYVVPICQDVSPRRD